MGQNNRSNIMATGQNTLSTAAELTIAENPQRIGLQIVNDDASIKIYVGYGSGVATTTGHIIKPAAQLTIEGYTGPVWVIAASGTPVCTYIEW